MFIIDAIFVWWLLRKWLARSGLQIAVQPQDGLGAAREALPARTPAQPWESLHGAPEPAVARSGGRHRAAPESAPDEAVQDVRQYWIDQAWARAGAA